MFKLINLDIDSLKPIVEYNLHTSKEPAMNLYYRKTQIWKLLSKAINSEEFIKIMIFNNDYFDIACVYTFCIYYENELSEIKLNDFDKQCVGRVLKYVFTSLGYKAKRRTRSIFYPIKYGTLYEIGDVNE
jgi:hypothetical protein